MNITWRYGAVAVLGLIAGLGTGFTIGRHYQHHYEHYLTRWMVDTTTGRVCNPNTDSHPENFGPKRNQS